ncbi:MAG: phosphoglycerate kinase [Patescibacteria group bacterium]|nr:phosphoglycerate kinase [Patescibacteria group bacterium]
MKFLSSLRQKNLKNKICLLRVDFNIKDSELNKNNLRIRAVLPTIKYLIKNGAKVVVLSHRGRPENHIKQLSLKPFVKILRKLLKTSASFIELGKINKKEICDSSKKIFLMENIRFYPEEEKNNSDFAKKIAFLGDLYINDAFAVSHRANASIGAITKFLPSYAGLLLEKEVKNLSIVMSNYKPPLTVILGGAKISDKIELIKNFFPKAKYFLISGGIANTIIEAQGLPIGKSIHEHSMIDFAKKLSKSEKIILPDDFKLYNQKILDIGPKTIEKFGKIIKNSKSIVWNGPMGEIEDKRFVLGSVKIADKLIKSKAFVIAGGGETAVIFANRKLPKNIFLSTGGGAMLEFLAGKKLSGLQALKK